jgi:hypothetical protein
MFLYILKLFMDISRPPRLQSYKIFKTQIEYICIHKNDELDFDKNFMVVESKDVFIRMGAIKDFIVLIKSYLKDCTEKGF